MKDWLTGPRKPYNNSHSGLRARLSCRQILPYHPCQGSPLLLCSSAAAAVTVGRPHNDPENLVQHWINPNHDQSAHHTALPCGGEIKTLKLATKSAFCLVPGNSCRMQSNVRVGVAACQPWIHLDCEVERLVFLEKNILNNAWHA